MPSRPRVKYRWPRRPHTERRAHPRVRLPTFPVDLHMDAKSAVRVGYGVDLGLGGVRLRYDRYLELFTRLEVEFDVPVADLHGDVEMTTVRVTGAVVWIEPDEELEGAEYELALKFARLDADAERALAIGLLQQLLYVEDSELT